MYTYNVFDDVLELRNMFDDFFKSSNVRRRNYPYTALYEGDDEIAIKAIVPGVTSEDISIELADNTLIIEGEKKADYTDNPYLRKERSFGKFKKSVKLPYRVESDKVDAELKDGILTVRLHKSEEAKPKRIEIN